MLNARVTRMFFDKPAVMRAVDRATRRVLSRFGSYVRRTARFSIRRRKAPSVPGAPPSSHTGDLKNRIYFAYEPQRQNVVIGPTPTNQVFFKADGRPVRGTVPEVLEKGGAIRILEVRKYGRWQRADLRSHRRLSGLPTRLRTVQIAARPYMGPAFRENRPKLDEFWRNSVR